ncbi:MAG: large subunit ribosomal protein L25 [Parcubacteria group bacterium Gr01-1014_44]|nr:MAG: large subunit ribosomal protein L25 [Parcubacteria group bacterium Gr01-1014_44]
MTKVEIKAEKRARVGKSLQTIRHNGILPAVVYGHDFETTPIQVDYKEFEKAYQQAGESSLVYINLDGQALPAIIYEAMRDAISDKFIHADFYKVNLKEKISAVVQLVFAGESPAVKELAGILVKNINEIEVEALPQDLPHEIKVDISGLKLLKDHLAVKDLKLPAGVGLKNKEKMEEIIALVQEPISEEELEKQLAVTETGVEEVEVIKKEPSAAEALEGEEKAEEKAPAPEEK